MIEWIEFKNFRALRDAKLPLGRFTLIVGANGSGKSTALSAFLLMSQSPLASIDDKIRTAGVTSSESVRIRGKWKETENDFVFFRKWSAGSVHPLNLQPDGSNRLRNQDHPLKAIAGVRLYSLDAGSIARQVHLQPQMELSPNGANLAGVLDRLRDVNPERFEALNRQLACWIPEFDRVLFETPEPGHRSIALRTREGRHVIKATDLSQGTLITLALLTLAHLPEPPPIVCLEEPDRGLHPRLLRDVQDALYRLAYPEGPDAQREPVQVIATTHNPYFLDLFREHPEEIVIAERVGMDAKFSRLSDREDLGEILADAPLSEVWYSGVLGGVPARG